MRRRKRNPSVGALAGAGALVGMAINLGTNGLVYALSESKRKAMQAAGASFWVSNAAVGAVAGAATAVVSAKAVG